MRRTLLVLAAIALVALGAVVPAAGAAEELTIDSVDVSEYPDISVMITLPASMAGAQPEADDFAVVLGGQRPRLDVFAAVNAPLDVVLLLDTSGSMSGEPLEQARDAASAFVDSMPDSASITVVAFGDTAQVVAAPGDDAVTAIQSLEAAGETALYDAVILGSDRFQQDAGTRRVMIVLSDGGDTASAMSLADATAAALGSGAELHAVALATSDTDTDALTAISDGSVTTASAADELTELYAALSVRLTGQYRLAFRTTAAGSAEMLVVVNGPSGVASSTIDLDLPVAGGTTATTIAQSGTTDTGAIVDTGPGRTIIATPGPLGQPWVLPAGIALVFVGALLSLWLTMRQRDEKPQRIVIERPDRETSSFIKSLANRASSLGDRYAERKSADSSIDLSLDRAGIKLRPGEFVVVSATSIIALTLLGLTLMGPFGAIVFGIGSALLPRTTLRMLAGRRQRAFAEQLEGTLQIIAGSLRAGYGLTQSISTVAEESPSPTSEEFDRVVVENRLGRSIEQSLEAMALRMENEDLGWVVEAIEIQHEVGGDLAEVLDTVTGTIRDRNLIKRQVKALSAEGRMSAIILLALPFVIAGFIAMVTPDYLAELTDTTIGRIMLGGAALLMVAGAAWIKKIVKVEF